jgi:DNA-binding NarL/FixJ family response regulator
MIRVLIVDDHAIVRNGLAQLLETTDDPNWSARPGTASRR